MASKQGLTDKQKRFVIEYLKDQNGTQAAIRAGYSQNTAQEQSSRLLSKAIIADAVAAGQAKVAKKAEITIESLAEELEEARGIALSEKQSSAAVSATMGKAKLYGLGIENKRLSGTVQIVNITSEQLGRLSADELAALETAYPVLQKLGLVDSSDTGGEAG